MVTPRTYRPKGTSASVTAAYSLSEEEVEFVALTAMKENASKSSIVSRAIRMLMEAKGEKAA
jgi:hypothetical protein